MLARDADGRPVKDAEVTFAISLGGGALIDADGNEGSSLVVRTNALGIAQVRLRAGRFTVRQPLVRAAGPAGSATPPRR